MNTFLRDLRLVSIAGFNFNEQPYAEEPNEWVIYDASSSNVITSVKFRILFLQKACKRDSLRDAINKLGTVGFIVHNDSWQKQRNKIDWIYSEITKLHNHEIKVKSRKEFILTFLLRYFDKYKENLGKSINIEDYIAVKLEEIKTIDSNYDNEPNARLKVIVASAGQGKTYYTRKSVADIAKKSGAANVPIYINSQQWKGMDLESLYPVWKIITACFRSFDAPITLIEGREEDFVQSTLSAELCEIFFDGFDEYILSTKAISAMETINALCEMASKTNSTITITSREEFWQSAFSESDCTKACPIEIIKLTPFDKKSAGEYFKKTILDEKRRATAFRYYNKLLGDLSNKPQGQELVGKGITLRLIADLCNAGDSNTNEYNHQDIAYPILEITKNICKREHKRQSLDVFTSDIQLKVIAAIALETSSGNNVSTTSIKKMLHTHKVTGEITEKIIGAGTQIGALVSHPLFRYDNTSDTWLIRYEQIKYNILAYKIVKPFSQRTIDASTECNKTHLDKILDCNGITLSNIIECILDQMFWGNTHDSYTKLAKNFIDHIRCTYNNTESINHFIISIAFSTIARMPKSTTGTEKSDTLKFLLGKNDYISDLTFSGDISSIHFTNVLFSKCTFNGATFINCNIIENLLFDTCTFKNLKISNSDEISQACFTNCNFDLTSQIAIETSAIRIGKHEYTFKNLDHDIEAFLDCFVGKHGTFKKEVFTSTIRQKAVGNSRYFDTVLDFLKQYICTSTGSGFSEMLGLRDEIEPELGLYAENAIYSGKIYELRRALRRHIFENNKAKKI